MKKNIFLLCVLIVVVIACLLFLLTTPSNVSSKTFPLNDTLSINNKFQPADASIHINIPKIDSLPRIDTLRINYSVREYKPFYNHLTDTLKIDSIKKGQEIDTLKLTDREKKKIGNIERIENLDKNLEVVDKQKITLDSLKIKKK